MKFLCPTCKAKYQIADDKVSGRAVRMKCRKCGNTIHIQGTTVESAESPHAHSSEVPPAVASAEPPPAPALSPAPSATVSPLAPAPKALAAPATKPKVPPRTQPLGGGARPAVVPTPTAARPPTAARAPSVVRPSAVSRPQAVPPRTPSVAASPPRAAVAPSPASPPAKPIALAPAPPAAKPVVPRAPSELKPPAPAATAPRSAAAAPKSPPPRGPAPGASKSVPPPFVGAPPRKSVPPPERAVVSKSVPPPRPLVAPPRAPPPPRKPVVAATLSAAEEEAPFATGSLAEPSTDAPPRAPTAPSSALAGAFSRAVDGAQGAALAETTTEVDDWYVGIHGHSVGPIRLSELRTKASAGAVTADSLVWREGFEQWQPLHTYPELLAIVEESVSSARASQAPLAPPAETPGGVAAPKPTVDPFAVTAPTMAAPTPIVATTSPPPVTGPVVVTEHEDLEVLAGLRRRKSPLAAWIAVVAALLFGLTIGFVLFSKKTPAEPVIKYVEVPAKPTASVVAAPPAPANAESAQPAGTVGSKAPKGPATKPTEKTAAPENEKPLNGLSGLAGLQNGPTAGPAGGESTGTTTGQPLDSAGVERTVGRYTASVRRSCWQPALDARDKDAPTSARVNVAITVGASGNVQNVSTSGDPHGYGGLASCIESRVRSWQFPASSGTTTVNVPFVFAAQ